MINRLLHSVSITAKMVLLTIVIGGTVWFFLDRVQERGLSEFYLAGLQEEFAHRATEDRLSFDDYIKKHHFTVEFYSQHSAIAGYLAKGFPATETSPVEHINVAPAWFPDRQQRMIFPPVQLAFLLDSNNQVREFYTREKTDIPEELLKPSPFLLNTSQGQCLLTTFAEVPYIINTKKIISGQGIHLATLIVASVMDDNFLIHSTGNFTHKHLMTLVTAKNGKQIILTSSNSEVLSPGTAVESIQEDYLMISRDFFDYGSSDMEIRTVFFMPIQDVENLIHDSLSTIRQQRLIMALSILLVCFLIILLVSRRIRQLTRDFIEFEQKELGLKEPIKLKGDEVAILNTRFKNLTQEVVTSREVIRNEARQLAEIAEAKVKIQNQILDQIHDSIISTDLHDRITAWNRGAERLFGYSQEEAIGQPISLPFPGPKYLNWKAQIEAQEYQENNYTLESPLIKKSGELFFAHVSLSKLKNESDTTTGFIISTMDITQQKMNESALRISKARFQDLTENINDWIWELNQDGMFTYASPRIIDLLGYTPEEIIGTTPFNLMPDDEAKRVGEIFFNIVQAQKPFKNLRNINIHKDGSLRVLETSGAPFFDEAGLFKGFRGIDRDITEQDKAREDLQHSRDLLNTAQEIGHIGSWEWDIGSGGLIWSDEVFRIFGQKPQEFMPSYDYFRGTIHPEDRVPVQRAILATVDNNTSYDIEHRIVLPDGTQRVVQEMARVVRDEDGLPLKMIGSIQDITEMKKIEQALYRYQNQLEERVVERTEELEKATKEAERANQAKSVFLASMSHELRTPMNSILGFSQLLETDEKEPLSDRQKNYMQRILQSGKHLLQLINDVLDLAKIESGEMEEISLEPVNLCSVCNECTNLVRHLAESNNIELLPCSLDKSTFIEADRTRFRQIFLNLLSNAIKYNKPGGQVSFHCEKFAETIRVIVADTGPGIAKEKIHLLFKPFDRLGAETSSIEGTGIGLTITKRLVELMHGSIDVESEVGRGTKFFIDFPSAESPAQKTKLAHTQAGIQGYDLKGNHTLLYVEDDPLNRELLREIMEQCAPGLKLLTAENAEIGINLAVEHKPDLILLDLTLPDIDGFNVFLRLKELQETKNTPVVALSGNALPLNIKKSLDAGFAAYLTKPFNISELNQVVGGILGRKIQ